MTTLRSVLRRYYAYNVTLSSGFYLPVFVLYLERQGLGMAGVGLVSGAFSVAMVAAEIPTGYVGDRIGRRAGLALGSALSAVALGGFVLAHTVAQFVALYAVWAVGWTFRSGTGDAWLYDLLDRYGEADEFARIRSRANRMTFAVSAVAAIASGLLVAVSWNLPFLANATLTALGVPVLFTLPAVEGESDGESFTVRDATRMLRLQIARPEIRWFIAYAALFSALVNVVRIFEQPALRAVGVPLPALGLIYAGFKFLSAGAVSTTGWIEDRFGARGTFALLVPVYALAAVAIAAVPLLVVPFVFLNRGLMVVVAPIRNQYLNDRLGGVGRATVLSGVSMVLSTASASAKLIGGHVAAATGPVRFLALAGIAITGAAGLLWIAASPVRPRSTSAANSASDLSGD